VIKSFDLNSDGLKEKITLVAAGRKYISDDNTFTFFANYTPITASTNGDLNRNSISAILTPAIAFGKSPSAMSVKMSIQAQPSIATMEKS
jgi:hypothetical protein